MSYLNREELINTLGGSLINPIRLFVNLFSKFAIRLKTLKIF